MQAHKGPTRDKIPEVVQRFASRYTEARQAVRRVQRTGSQDSPRSTRMLTERTAAQSRIRICKQASDILAGSLALASSIGLVALSADSTWQLITIRLDRSYADVRITIVLVALTTYMAAFGWWMGYKLVPSIASQVAGQGMFSGAHGCMGSIIEFAAWATNLVAAIIVYQIHTLGDTWTHLLQEGPVLWQWIALCCCSFLLTAQTPSIGMPALHRAPCRRRYATGR